MRKWIFVVLMLLATAPVVMGQGCVVCTKTAASLDEKGARGLNIGILYLALLPLGLMGTIGFIWWKSNRGS